MTEKGQPKPLHQRLRVELPDEYPYRPIDSQAVLRSRRDWQIARWTAADKAILWLVIASTLAAALIL